MSVDCIDHGRKGNRDGYVQVRLPGESNKMHMLHRLVYCNAHGINLADIKGLVVRHTCDNPRCINPDHLLVGTHKDNTDDKVSRHRQPQRALHGRAKLTEYDVEFIRTHYDKYSKEHNASALARMFNVSQTCIRKVVTGENWNEAKKHIK